MFVIVLILLVTLLCNGLVRVEVGSVNKRPSVLLHPSAGRIALVNSELNSFALVGSLSLELTAELMST
jgi:hypothetical protein